ncbi:(2Fe-2S)-binding protein [Actinokineospora diospyrosa]|uniref:FhuF 2Fe-2S C-terminal domain-containing protein n=1 Tax=Actinokineospora diospyrosa TaxID=103728 RepID=A0ABT1IMD9_9PSEU|nr:(2Fe-2S)-binding protein [Actinokineospora diospyrosa]MCP2273818.1 FhuF 2Fe-2S C-terminal domain-containing protein [Actinokineospora diospyrosa]
MSGVPEVYAAIAARLPYHVGAAAVGLSPVPGSRGSDADWVAEQITAAGRMYRFRDRRVLGVLWWYSASMMVPAPTVESLVVTGMALDPAAVTLYLHPDGRILAATSDSLCSAPGAALRGVFESVISAVAAVTGAKARTLWAVAADSLANRVLWSGGTPELALSLAADMPELPTPRFVNVNGRDYVRRGSCCLIYEATGGPKCVSCPRQLPEERLARLSAL